MPMVVSIQIAKFKLLPTPKEIHFAKFKIIHYLVCMYMYAHLQLCTYNVIYAFAPTLHPQLVNKGIFMVSLISNKGVLRPRRQQASTNTNSFKAKLELAKAVFLEPELPYHWFYLSICLFGFLVHEFLFVILLVSGI